MDKPLHTLSLIDAVKGIENRRFTSEEYTQALLARIAFARRRNPGLGLAQAGGGDQGRPPFR